MRRVVEERNEAEAIGARAREEITVRFSRKAVGALMRQELERIASTGTRP